jgi:hypothetical protein
MLDVNGNGTQDATLLLAEGIVLTLEDFHF